MLSAEIGQIETCETKRPRTLATVAVLGAAIILAHLPRFLIFTFYVDGIRSTNDRALFVLAPVSTLFLTVMFTIILVRRLPSLAAFDCVWLRMTRREAIVFWLLPLGIVVAMACTALPIWRFGLPLRKVIAFSGGYDAYRNTGFLVWMAVCSALLFPVTEEIFWRGYVQSTLLRVCHPALALLAQAFLFGLIHFRPAMGFLQASLFGLVFGIWCYRRKTLLPVIMMHICINAALTGLNIPEWLEMRQMRDSHNYAAEFLELSKPAGYDPNNDARGEYTEACRLIDQFPNEFSDLRKQYPTQWNQQERSKVEDWIESNLEALELVEEGSTKSYYWVEYEHLKKRMTLFPCWMTETRSLIYALDMRAELRSARGEYREALNDVETCYRLGRHLSANKDGISQLVGYASRAFSLGTSRTILSHEQIDPSLLKHLQNLFETFAQDDVSGFDFTSGRLTALDAIQCIFTDDGQGGGRVARVAFRKQLYLEREFKLEAGTLSLVKNSDIRAWRKLDRRGTTSDVHKYYDLAEKASLLSPWQYKRYRGMVKLDIDTLRIQNVLIRTLTTPIERLLNIAARACLDRDAIIAILAVLRYQADKGHPPESLLVLVSEGYLEAVSQDVFGLGPLIYRRTGDDFLLYSFGADLDDDGGTPSKWGEGEKGGDQVFWPVGESDRSPEDNNLDNAD